MFSFVLTPGEEITLTWGDICKSIPPNYDYIACFGFEEPTVWVLGQIRHVWDSSFGFVYCLRRIT